MSKIFCCGQGGCDIIVIDDYAQAYAKEQREIWVKEEKRRKGIFPPIDEQNEFMEAAYQRHKNINLTA